MKIGMMADIYKPHVSGVTNYISLNKRFIEAQGHEVYIFTFGDKSIIEDEENVIRSPGLPVIDTGYYVNFRYQREARRLLQSMDVVHVHHPFLSGTLAMRYCRPRNIPIVFTNHTRYDLYTHAYFPILPEGFGETAMKAYLPPFCRSCNMVIAPSKGIAEVMQGLGIDTDIEVVPNGVDLEPFRQKSTPIERSQFKISEDTVVLIYIGRLGPEKNLTFLIRAYGGISEAFNNVQLVLVGDGPERENLQSLVGHMGLTERVHFTGLVPYQQIPQYLTMADIFVTASITEVHPLSLIEAMAAGRPVLGINSPGVGDTVENGITGFLSSNNIASYTAKMVLMITDKDKRAQMGRQAFQRSENYSIRKTTQVMIQHYDRLIHSSSINKPGLSNLINRFIKPKS